MPLRFLKITVFLDIGTKTMKKFPLVIYPDQKIKFSISIFLESIFYIWNICTYEAFESYGLFSE